MRETTEEIQTVTKRTDSVIQKKSRTEQENKVHQRKIIIEQLQGIQDAEQSLKTYLAGYKVGDPTDMLNLYGMSLDGLDNSRIYNMNDAIGQLQGRLNDNTLRKEFVDYLDWFRLDPKRILQDKPHGYIPDGLLHDIDEQMKKIQGFIDKFSKEMESSWLKSVKRINQSLVRL